MASTLSITVDVSKAVAALGTLSGPGMTVKLGAGLREAALFGERAVAAKTPVKTGAARASIKASQIAPLAWKITSPLAYVPGLEGGTRAHEIRPRGRFLRFQVGGRVVFARRVHHPGTKGRFMFRDGASQLVSALPGIIGKHIGAGR